MPRGKEGVLHHWRLGLVGAVKYWAEGSKADASACIIGLIRELGLSDSIKSSLFKEEMHANEVRKHICERLKAALSVCKSCHTEEQRQEYGILLASVMPAEGVNMMDAIAAVLSFKYGRRKGRARIATRQCEVRRQFDIEAAVLPIFPRQPPLAMMNPLCPGEIVLCRGEKAEIAQISADGRCKLIFRSRGECQEVTYKSMFGKGDGSARLQRVPPSLRPAARVMRKDAVSAEVQLHVQEVYEKTCPISPHQRDQMKRRLSRHVVQTAPALIMMLTFDELFAMFQKEYPMDKLKRTRFKQMKPWNLKKAYRETCLCRCCELFNLYAAALHTVGNLLEALLPPRSTQANTHEGDQSCDDDDSDDGENEQNDDADGDAHFAKDLQKLVKFCKHEFKSEMVKDLVCGGCLETASPECVAANCPQCGFQALWKPVRNKLVGANGQLCDGTHRHWQSRIRYEVLRSGGSTPSDGSNSDEKEALRERREASVIEFLDDFLKSSAKFPAHRQLIRASKAAALARERNAWIGMLLSDYDWSENGVIMTARQIQSEYWSLVHFSLFIQITWYLSSEAWLHQRSLLAVGAEVTVQSDANDFSSLAPTKGAFYAKVVCAPSCEGELELYSVKVYSHPTMADGEKIDGIPRKRLRHRVKYTTTNVGVTDEKRHDAITTQHFLNKQFQHWLLALDREKFWAWVGHSDNASHFKSGAMMNYWSCKLAELDFLKMCWVDFGCPGHGKGPWDGLGAVLKQYVTRDITNNFILTESGYITCPAEVAEHLRKRVGSVEWMEAHKDKHINEIVVFYAPHQEIQRPRVDHKFESLVGAANSYSYMMLAPDQIARRERSCWCMGCVAACGRGNMSSSGTYLVCEECTHRDKLVWVQQTVKDLGTGLAGRRKEAQDEGKKFARMLRAPTASKPHDGFIAIQVSTDRR